MGSAATRRAPTAAARHKRWGAPQRGDPGGLERPRQRQAKAKNGYSTGEWDEKNDRKQQGKEEGGEK